MRASLVNGAVVRWQALQGSLSGHGLMHDRGRGRQRNAAGQARQDHDDDQEVCPGKRPDFWASLQDRIQRAARTLVIIAAKFA